jgi:hypothetical protein
MAPTDTTTLVDLPAPVTTPAQRRITIAALAVAGVIVAAGIFGGGTAVGFYANWTSNHQSVTSDQPLGTSDGSSETQQGPSGDTAPSVPGSRR